MTERTALYRLFDTAGELIYVGISRAPEARWKGHASQSPWWPEVARKAVEWFEDRDTAAVREVEAIQTELPRYNVSHSLAPPSPRDLECDELQLGQARANLTDVVNRVSIAKVVIFLVRSNRDRTRLAAIIPFDLLAAVPAAGGLEKAIDVLNQHATSPEADGAPSQKG